MRSKTLIGALEGVTAKWAKQRKQEERVTSARANRRYVMTRVRETSLADMVFHVLPEAWKKASGDGKYPTLARQMYYAVRPLLQSYTGKPLSYGYFAQTLLPDYLRMSRSDWDVVYDARGNFREPHTKTTVPLGTLQVRDYLGKVGRYVTPTSAPAIELNATFPTTGPKHRYSAVLFLEKEGFQPLLDAARIAERYDLGVMSTKGMSVTASRTLVETLCGAHGIRLLILHDLDVSGFTIAGTIRSSTRRYQFTRDFHVIDLGLRLADAEDMGLESEEVFFREREDLTAKAATLRRHGATDEEIDFLIDGQERVELNAMTSPQFVTFLERKLEENGVTKVVPDAATLRIAAQRAGAIARMQDEIDEISMSIGDVDVPDDLEAQVRARLVERPELTWDQVLVSVMGGRIAPLIGEDEDEDDDDDY